jgi:hypothetical protein
MSYLAYDKLLNPKLKKRKKLKIPNKSQLRSIMGTKLPLSPEGTMGENSFPGSDITYSPPPPVISSPMVNLGCLNSTTITDIAQVNVNWSMGQLPSNLVTGSNQPETDNVSARSPNSTTFGDFLAEGGLLNSASSTPFQYTVGLTSDVNLYNINTVAAGYSSITLSQEGLLWTLWPLVSPTRPVSNIPVSDTYFDQFILGTARKSRYAIGQMGFFINNQLQGCTPFGAINQNQVVPVGANVSASYPKILLGVQGLNKSLLTTTEQQVGIVVIKISEQIARIYNPISGISSDQRYIYVGYDGWAVIYTTANPIGSMAGQTFITPQTVSGSILQENYQVVLPPNIPQTIYYKNIPRLVPVDNVDGLIGNITA